MTTNRPLQRVCQFGIEKLYFREDQAIHAPDCCIALKTNLFNPEDVSVCLIVPRFGAHHVAVKHDAWMKESHLMASKIEL